METCKKKFSIRRFITAMMAAVMVMGSLPGYVPEVFAASTKKLIKFNITDKNTSGTINGATVTVTYQEDVGDEYETVWENRSVVVGNPASGQEFETNYSCISYGYSVSASGYKIATGSIDKTQDSPITVNVEMEAASSPDAANLDAIVTKFKTEDSLQANYNKYTNVKDYIKDVITGYSLTGVNDVIVTLKSVDKIDGDNPPANLVASDGSINTENKASANIGRAKCTFTLGINSETSESIQKEINIITTVEGINKLATAEKDSLDFSKIKGSNTSAGSIESDLYLPQFISGKSTTSWCEISWTSSDTNVITIPGIASGANNTYVATINPSADDKEVTLTASLTVQKDATHKTTSMSGFVTGLSTEIKVTVKGTGASDTALKAALNKVIEKGPDGKFLHIFSDLDKSKPLDPNNVSTSRIYFDKATNIDSLIRSKELFASYDGTDNLFKCGSSDYPNQSFINPSTGGTVDVTVPSEGSKKGKLKLTFNHGGATASIEFELTVVSAGEAEKNEAIELMEFAKAHFWEAVNDNWNASKDDIKKGLHAFYEINKDENGNLVVCYDQNKMTNTGIKVQGYFDGNNMGAEGYNQFKSSEPDVIKHNLVMADTLPEYNTPVTISCILSSCKFEKQALQNPTDKKLSKLANQEVSVTVTVKGPKGEAPASLKEPHKDINVLLTVVDKGKIVKANDGSYMAQKKVAVKNLNGDKKITLDEVLECAHETFNSKDGYKTDESGAVLMLWGVKAKDSGYVRNNSFTKAVTNASVEDNDNITAFIYKDDVAWTDRYTFFDVTSKNIGAGEELLLTLKGIKGEDKVNCAGVKIATLGGTDLGTTDSNGQVKVKFDKSGTYIVASEGTLKDGGNDCTVVPATCIVTVAGNTQLEPEKSKPDQPEQVAPQEQNKPEEKQKEEIKPEEKKPEPVGDQTVKVKSIKLNKSSAKIEVGESVNLTAKVNPSNAGFKWSVPETDIVSVTANGDGIDVKALKAGKVTITAISADGKKKASCKITVNGPVEAKSITIKKDASKIEIGHTTGLTAKISPAKTADQTVTWESLTPELASVEGNGLKATVTGLAAGKAKIKATTANGKHKEVTITVKGPVEASGVTIKKNGKKLEVGKTIGLKATVTPKETVDKSITWECLTPDLASIESEGNVATVTGLKEGKAKIRATAANGKHKDITITVKGPVVAKNVSIKKKSSKLEIGKNMLLTAKVTPTKAIDKTVTWENLSPEIVKLDVNGSKATITGLSAGKAAIKATTVNGKTRTVYVTIKEPKVKK